MRNLIIRKAEISDLDMVVDMQLSLQRHLEKCSSSVWRYTEERKKFLRQDYVKYLADENSLLLVAELKGEVVGFLSSTVAHRTDHLPKIIGNISSIYIQENFRRQGIGSRLVREACRFFRSKNAESLNLRYVLGNSEAERFWKTLGFKPILVTAGTNINTIEDYLKRGI